MDTDFDDLVFLVQNNHVDMDKFERIINATLPHARKFDLDPAFLEHLQELKNRLK